MTESPDNDTAPKPPLAAEAAFGDACFQAASDAIVVAEVQTGLVVEVNAAACRLFGYERSQLLGRHQAELHPAEMQEQYVAQFRRYAGGTPQPVAAWIVTAEGERVPCEISANVLQHPDGRSLLQGVFRDLRQRWQVEESLRESAQRYREIFEKSAAAQILVEPESTRIVDANPAAAHFYGYPLEQLRGMLVTDFSLSSPRWLKQQFAELNGPRLFAGRAHRLANGELRDVDIYSGPVELEGRRYLHNIVHDVSARRRSERRYQALFQEARDAIFIADPETGVIIEANQQAEKLVERSREALIGMHQSELHPASERDQYRRLFMRHVQGGGVQAAELTVVTASGAEIPVEISASMVELSEGRRAIQGIFRDIRWRKQAEQAREEGAQVYRQMFRNNVAIKLLIDPEDSRIVDANDAAAEFYRCSIEELCGMRIHDISGDDEQVCARQMLEACAGRTELQCRHRLADGETREVEIHIGPITVGGRNYLHAIVQDVTARNQEGQLQLARGRILELIARDRSIEEVVQELCATLEARLGQGQAVLLLEQRGRLVPVQSARVSGTLRAALGGLPAAAVQSGEPGPGLGGFEDLAEHPGLAHAAPLLKAAGLTACWSLTLFSRDGRLLGLFLVLLEQGRSPRPADVALMQELGQLATVALEQRLLSEALVHQAQHDSLTGLPNRALLLDRLEQSVLHAQRLGRSLAVMLLDLDDFKLINDSLGHSAGDQLLQQVAARLEECMRSDDTVARLGGDEFVLVLPLAEREHATVVAEKVLQALSPTFSVADRDLHALASIGVSLYPQDGASAELLLQAADTAMYAAKYGGKHRYHFFAENMNRQVTERLTLESEMHRALAGDEFELYFQPRVLLADERVAGAEALLRWRHPERGVLVPGAFLQVAEQSRLIDGIDAWVFEHACRQVARWRAKGKTLLLSVNLSASQLHAPDFADGLMATLEAHAIAADCLELEITESMLMHDISRATEQLLRVKRLAPGLRVAIDDFGSGYSSLNYLRHLPIDTLKIDRAFVSDLTSDRGAGSAAAIVKTIIDLGRNLDLQVLAEGIETREQLEALRELGCHEGQGYYFSRPLPLAEFEHLLP